jgi:hypothetical protein
LIVFREVFEMLNRGVGLVDQLCHLKLCHREVFERRWMQGDVRCPALLTYFWMAPESQCRRYFSVQPICNSWAFSTWHTKI